MEDSLKQLENLIKKTDRKFVHIQQPHQQQQEEEEYLIAENLESKFSSTSSSNSRTKKKQSSSLFELRTFLEKNNNLIDLFVNNEDQQQQQENSSLFKKLLNGSLSILSQKKKLDDEEEEREKKDQLEQNLTSLSLEIDIKKRLINELESNYKNLEQMKLHYEEKLNILHDRIRRIEQERDKIISNMSKSITKSVCVCGFD